jgi:hypothetical protein
MPLPIKTTSTVTVGTSPVTLYTITPSKNGGVKLFYVADNVGLATRSDDLMVSWDLTDNIAKVSDLSTLDNIDYVTAPIKCVGAKAATGTTCTDGAHQVKIAYATANGTTEMGAAMDSAVTVTGNDDISLSSIPVSADAAVTAKNVYMTAAGGTDYFYVAQIAKASTTYTIACADASLLVAGPVVNTSAQATTTALTFGASLSAGVVSLTATSTSGTWTVDTVEIARIA